MRVTAHTHGRTALLAERRRLAFTLIELLVVIVIIAILAAMLLPVLARAKMKGQMITCINDSRQLALGWLMYADDNRGGLPYNHDGPGAGKSQGDESWAGGWLDFTTSTDNTNTEYLIDHDRFGYQFSAYLGPYIKTPAVFKCPADKSMAPAGGTTAPRCRSISMNCYVGTASRTWASGSKWQVSSNITQIAYPTMQFVFLDEREDSINDGWFGTDPDTVYQLVDYPASYHNNAGGFAFADGHSEVHKWFDGRTMPVLLKGQLLPLNVNLPGDKDVLWEAQHSVGAIVYP